MRNSRLDSVLDTLHGLSSSVAVATKRRKRLRREHFVFATQTLSSIMNTLAVFIPKVRPAATILKTLQEATPAMSAIPMTFEDPPSVTRIPHAELDLFTRLRAVESQLYDTAGEHRIRLEAQRDMLLKLIADNEQRRTVR